MLDQLRVYWDIGTNNDTDYFTKHHPPIHHRQMRPGYIHTLNLVIPVPHTIILSKGVLNQVPGTHPCVDYFKTIRSEPQSMTEKCHTVRRLNRPRQHLM